MSKYISILFMISVLGCWHGKNEKEYQSDVQTAHLIELQNRGFDTIRVDMGKSIIMWKGTKMRGAGKHEGTINLNDAYLLYDEDSIFGGEIEVDINTLQVTDIPEHEQIPRNNLTEHLLSKDFLEANVFPIATFQVTKVTYITNRELSIQGNMTIKGTSKNLNLTAYIQDDIISARFRFDRFDWNIAYEGNWLENTLVDAEVEINLVLYLLQ